MNHTNLFGYPAIENSIIQKIEWPIFQQAGIEVFIKREDLIHPVISGNKWRKLSGYLQEYNSKSAKGIISFGGAYSNHLHALAGVGALHNIPTVGIVRGEELANEHTNSSLLFLKKWGMRLHFVPRSEYKLAIESPTIQEIIKEYPSYLIVPEGGQGETGEKGCGQILDPQQSQLFDFVGVCVGTGTTLKGLSNAHLHTRFLGFLCLKSQVFAQQLQNNLPPTVHIIANYHFGGFGKSNHILTHFIDSFIAHTQLPIEFVYTGKMLYGLSDMAKNGFFKTGQKILLIHTGGLRYWEKATF